MGSTDDVVGGLEKIITASIFATDCTSAQRAIDYIRKLRADFERRKCENDAAWDSAVHNQKRAESAEALLTEAVDMFTYEQEGRRFAGIIGDSDVTDELAAILAKRNA